MATMLRTPCAPLVLPRTMKPSKPGVSWSGGCVHVCGVCVSEDAEASAFYWKLVVAQTRFLARDVCCTWNVRQQCVSLQTARARREYPANSVACTATVNLVSVLGKKTSAPSVGHGHVKFGAHTSGRRLSMRGARSLICKVSALPSVLRTCLPIAQAHIRSAMQRAELITCAFMRSVQASQTLSTVPAAQARPAATMGLQNPPSRHKCFSRWRASSCRI